MRVVLVIGGGIGLLALSLLYGWMLGGAAPDFALAAKPFIPVWALIALANLWVGLAGYAVKE